MPHDDYLYAGPTDLHLLPGLQAARWLVFGVCHACRRLGVRDRLIFDGFAAWRVAGRELPVDTVLRASLLDRLGGAWARVDDERHAAEHSIESLLPWLATAAPQARFVPILVPGLDWERLQALADTVAAVLADICREEGWSPGRDLGLLISADAVHYGCEGWGPRGGYHPFGCDAAGHAAGVAQDVTLAEATLAGPLTDDGLARFARLVWDPDHPEYPYRITWCGLYSIPCGLAVAGRLQAALALPPLTGHLLRYGDSVGDGRLDLPRTGLGVTAPNTLAHWVGYPALGYVAAE
jgi:AmmeMemoRadiSam system protein B